MGNFVIDNLKKLIREKPLQAGIMALGEDYNLKKLLLGRDERGDVTETVFEFFCPSCREKPMSGYLTDGGKHWTCSCCNAGGDIIEFYRAKNLLDYSAKGVYFKAIEHLADALDIPHPPMSNMTKQEKLIIEGTDGEPPDEEFINPILEGPRGYYKLGTRGVQLVTNFLISPLFLVTSEKERYYEVMVTKKGEQGFKKKAGISSDALYSPERLTSELAREVNSDKLGFYGSPRDMHFLREVIVSRDIPGKAGVAFGGVHRTAGGYVYVNAAGAVDGSGEVFDELALTDKYEKEPSNILKNDKISKDEFLPLMKDFFGMNRRDVMGAVIAFMTGCFLKGHFWENEGLMLKLPYLFIIGESGSGKSEMADTVVKPFFDIKESYSCLGARETSAVRLTPTSNATPLLLEDHEPHKMTEGQKLTISAILHNGYNRDQANFRVSKEGKITAFPVNRPILLIGEEAPESTAISERSLQFRVSKRDIKENPEMTAHFERLKERREELGRLSKSVLLFTLNISDKRLEEIAARTKAVKMNYGSRVTVNVRSLLVGLYTFEMMASEMGFSMADMAGCDTPTLIKEMLAEISRFSGAEKVLSVLDETLKILDRMAHAGELKEGYHYRADMDKSGFAYVAFMPERFYDTFNEYCRKKDVPEEHLKSVREFEVYVERSEYFTEKKKMRFSKEQFSDEKKAGTKDYRVLVMSQEKIYKKLGDNHFTVNAKKPLDEDEEKVVAELF